MKKTTPFKFAVGDSVVYSAGNWHYIVAFRFRSHDGVNRYVVRCSEDGEICPCDQRTHDGSAACAVHCESALRAF